MLLEPPQTVCFWAAGTQRQAASLAAEKQALQDKLDASLTASTAMQAELSGQRQSTLEAEAALAEAQKSAQQLRQAAEQSKQEKALAEQQALQLKAVEGQLQVPFTLVGP